MNYPWIDTARKYLGTREYPGATSNPIILGFWKLARLSGIKDDAVPWCSGFACAMFESSGIMSPRSDSAKSWLAWGMPLTVPTLGCIVVFQRPGGYHVGFVVGQDKSGRLMVLGGNQGDAVSIAAFSRDRVAGYRYPIGDIYTRSTDPLPVLAGYAASASEA